ncbi:MAG: hypothetical protein VX951_00905 [Planctomycetota bacterium]|nr:hypothetical protein [Planctomycetota bacterium]
MQGPGAGRLAVRGTVWGGLVVLLLVGVTWQVLPEDLQIQVGALYFWSGVAVGLLSAAIGNGLIAFGSMKAPEDPTNSTGFIRAVVLDFALQFACAATCILGLIFKGLKFQHVAAFGITFALAVVACRMAGTMVVSRALVARSKQRSQDPETGSSPAQNLPR